MLALSFLRLLFHLKAKSTTGSKLDKNVVGRNVKPCVILALYLILLTCQFASKESSN